MSTFNKLQRDFQNYLTTGQSNIEHLVVEKAKSRLQIYSNAYTSRLEEALASNYPCLKTYLGEDTFHRLSKEYIFTSPSPHRSIRWYGDTLPHFLCHSDWSTTYAYLPELADFEWKMTLAFDAPDAPVFELHQMTTIAPEDWGSMILQLHPSVLRANHVWNVVPLWQAVADQNPFPVMHASLEKTPWILWRHAYINRFYTLPVDEAWAIDLVIQGATFGTLCEGLYQWHSEEEVGLRAASLLKSWIQSGLIETIA